MEFGRFQPPLSLTDQERRLLQLALEGRAPHQIAHLLNVTERTVRFSLLNVGKKLEVFSQL